MDSNKPISSKTLLESVGSSDTLKAELYNLLKSWKIEDLIDYFMEQQLYVDILEKLTPKMAIRIFSNTEVSLGVQIHFFQEWNLWKTTLNNTSVIEEKEDDIVAGVISLKEILQSNPYGVSVKKSYDNEQALNDNTRKLLCESILHYCIDNNHSLTVKDSEKLAKQIVNVFPNEEMAYYFQHRPRGAPLGKIYQKYRNWKCNLSRKSKNGKNIVKEKEADLAEDLLSAEESYRILKHEYKNLPFEDVLQHWTKCQCRRLTSRKDVGESISKKELEEWPMYKEPLGYKLIDMDFTFLYGENNNLLDNCNSFTEVMIEKVLPLYTLKLKDDDKAFFDYLTNNKSNAKKDSILYIVLHLIHTILPMSRIQNPVLRKGNTRFYSKSESRNSFIKICCTEAEYNTFYEKKRMTPRADFPCISIIGSIEEPCAIYYNFSTIKYKFFSLSKAVDICFKTFYLFNIMFPEECTPMWDFINHHFYKIARDKRVVHPTVKILIKNIKEYQENAAMDVSD